MELGTRTILHIDMDSFFASVEAREHPEHIGSPIIIGADPKEGRGRGVVAACSYEARKFGVHSAMPISKAYRLCPQAVYLPVNMELYESVSEEIMELLRSFSDLVEPVSIDEAFLDATHIVGDYAGPLELAGEIKLKIEEQLNLSCSIGIAHNKSIAKIASDHNKPAGITHVIYDEFKHFLEPLPVGRISGIGPKTQEILLQLGIYTVSELANARKQVLQESLGKFGLELWNIANGLENEEVIAAGPPVSSISREYTFERDTSNYELIDKQLLKMSTDAFEMFITEHQYFKTVTLKVRFEDFTTITRSKSLNVHTQSYVKIMTTIRELLKEFQRDRRILRLIGIKLSNLRALDEKQDTLKKWQ